VNDSELLLQPGSIGLLAAAYILVQLSAAFAAVHAVFNSRSAQGATAWAIGLVSAPMIALPLYLVFGRNRFVGYVDARRTANEDHHWITERARNICDEYRSNLPEYGGRLRSLERLAHLPFTCGNRPTLLPDGRLAFDEMFAAIESASDYVLVQFFIVRDDELGQRLKSLLIAKAAEGVAVYFLYDDIGSSKLPGDYVRECRNAGVRMEAFGANRGKGSRFQVNFRNHRKSVVVDGDLAFVGGLNVGDEYVGCSARFGSWRDTHMAVAGPSADAVQLIFAEDWHWATGETIDALEWQTRPVPGHNADVLVLASGPADELETCNLMFVQAIHAAEKRFWIASPYFVPNSEVVAALQIAGLRGVDVRILLPANPDHRLVYLASFYFMRQTGGHGVRFFRYDEGFMHQKAFLIDDRAAGIGTANLDNRSFRLNFEITLLTIDTQFAAEVAEMFERDFERCKEVRHDEIDEKGALFRIAAAGSRLLSPML
jgi:cardiolipin synthase